jgi:ABC-type Na+ efflux pump permease subunit
MSDESITAIKALVWKDSKNIVPYLAFCIVITAWALILIVFSGSMTGNSPESLDGLVAYAPFIIAMFSAAVMIPSVSEEARENTMESLLCTPMDHRDILCSKVLFIIVFPYMISMIIMLPLLVVLGKPVVSVMVLYQMVVDLPLALFVVASATTAWLVIPGKLHWILNMVTSACILVSLFFYFNVGASYGLSFSPPVSPIITTILLVLSLSLVYAMCEKIATIEKSDVI